MNGTDPFDAKPQNSERRNLVCLDANLLLVFLVGMLDPAWIADFKRTRTIGRTGFEILLDSLPSAGRPVCTASVLAEVSNLAPQRWTEAFHSAMRAWVEVVPDQPVEPKSAVSASCFDTLGYADASLWRLAEAGITVMTVDFPLANRLAQAGLPVVNFNHLLSDFIE